MDMNWLISDHKNFKYYLTLTLLSMGAARLDGWRTPRI